MKRTILAVALMMGVSAATFANNHMKVVVVNNTTTTNDLNITALKGLKFKLSVNDAAKHTLVSLVNENNEVLFSEYAGANGDYSKVFDLSNLADGKYAFVLRTGSEKITKEVEIKTTTQRSASL